MVNNVNSKDMKTKIFLAILLIIVGCIMVSCEKDPYIIEASAGLGGIISPSGKIEVVSGGNLNITFTPNVEFEIDIMKVDGIVTVPTNSSYTFSNITSGHRLEVTFKKIVKFTIEALVGTGGTISPETSEVVSGENLTFTFKPNVGFDIDLVKVDEVVVVPTNLSYTFINVASNHKIEVMYKKTLSWYLMQGSWTKDSTIIRQDDGTWFHYATSIPGVNTFLPNGRFTTYLNGVLVGDGPWFINEVTNPPILNWGGDIVEIEKLNETSLILAKYDVQCIGCPDPNHRGAIRNIFSHH